MVKKDFVGRKTLLVADNMPTPQISQSVVLEELDSGNFYRSNGSVISIINGPDKAETLSNKIIPVEDNELVGFDTTIDHPFLKNFEQKGHITPAASVADSFDGLVSGSILHNADSIKVSANNGVIVAFQSLIDDEKLGFNSPIPIARRDKGYEVKAEIISNAQIVLLGFSTASNFDPVNIFSALDKGVAIGWTLDSPWIRTWNHDGNGIIGVATSAIGKGLTVHTFEIKLTATNIVCIIDNAQTITINFNLMGLTDNLYLLSYGIH